MTHALASAGGPSSRSRHGSTAFADIRTRVQFSTAEEPEPRRIRLRNAARRRLGRREWVAIGCAAMLGSGLVAWSGSSDRAAAEAPPVAADPAPVAEWVEINRPFPLYDISGGDFAKLPMHYGARRETVGSARQDRLTFGSPKAGDPFLLVTFDRRNGPRDTTSLYVDMARLAGDAGVPVVRAGLSTSLNTRFGAFEVSPISIGETSRTSACIGFRRAPSPSSATLQIAGLACGGDDRVIDPATLACTIDRIDLVAAGDDAELQALFAESERRRGLGCDRSRKAGLALRLPASVVRQTIGTLKGSIGPTADRSGPASKNATRN